jgi:predicted DNA-binding transcriptional regulator YafY
MPNSAVPAASGGHARRARPPSLETLAFTLELLKRVPRGRKISAPDLWKQLKEAGWDRDLRTVQRQLDELSRHFDIERDERSKPFGYQWKPQARGLSLPGLTEKESLVLALAEQHLAVLLPAEVMHSMQPYFAQARATLAAHPEDGARTRAAREWMRKVRVVSTSQPLLPPALKPGVFEAVSRALYRDQWLDIEYQNSAHRRVKGTVMPLGLAQQGERLYLVCRFRGHDNERSLAVHRIYAVKETGLPFRRPDGFDLQAYDDNGRFAFGDGKRVRIEFLIRKDAGLHLLESRLSADQQVEDAGEDYRIRATVTSTERLKWWLRGFGDEVTVLAPVSLARAVHAHRTGAEA